MADTHGEYEIMVELLQAQKIIDRKLGWSFGRGHMVVTGDIFDRGPHQLQILWLLYKLEDEARKAGGGLHIVLGNHEAMIVRGDLRYLHPRHAGTAAALGHQNYADLFDASTLLGVWLRSKPSLFRIDDMLFAHGGVSPDLAKSGMNLSDINLRLRAVLDWRKDGPRLSGQDALLAGEAGPLWYRGYFSTPGNTKYGPVLGDGEVSQALAVFGARRIFVGHTPQEHANLLFGGKVAAVHVYPECDKDGKPVIEAAIRLRGVWQVADALGARKTFPESR
nr:metallophosphoesterase [Sphingomonas colocasiae]